jgi:hypothetical protein
MRPWESGGWVEVSMDEQSFSPSHWMECAAFELGGRLQGQATRIYNLILLQ